VAEILRSSRHVSHEPAFHFEPKNRNRKKQAGENASLVPGRRASPGERRRTEELLSLPSQARAKAAVTNRQVKSRCCQVEFRCIVVADFPWRFLQSLLTETLRMLFRQFGICFCRCVAFEVATLPSNHSKNSEKLHCKPGKTVQQHFATKANPFLPATPHPRHLHAWRDHHQACFRAQASPTCIILLDRIYDSSCQKET
jgi:hypothetical protein